jgi:two-component system, chemotaxis family, protein-glutamate methylesterase/glutaminase
MFTVLGSLPPEFSLPILIAQHLLPNVTSLLATALGSHVQLRVVEAFDKCPLQAGEIYVAVPDYHLTVEREVGDEYTVGLSQEPPDCFSRPSINVLFESAAVATKGRLIGVILTGANDDGARGAACLKRWGGQLLVQEPSTAEWSPMPAATLASTIPDLVGTTADIGRHLCKLGALDERRL